MTAKPPYRVPSMGEIAEVPWNGFNAISTFSGCGGSSLGYRMAGFRVLWASEFIEAAQDTYRANAADHTILDTRDIRQVTGADLLASIGLKRGQIDLMDGSPPCASFSTAGKREAGWGKVKAYSDSRQRVDDLFFEYARLIEECQPRTFVAENVSGLVKGTAKGYFKAILRALKNSGYQVHAKLLNAAWLGVPQARRRLIFVGVRNDLAKLPAFPRPLSYQYTVRDALPWILAQGDNGTFRGGAMRPADRPSPTIATGPAHGNGDYPPGYVIPEQGARLIHDTSGTHSLGDVTGQPAPAITVGAGGMNSRHFQIHALTGPPPRDGGEPVFRDPETGTDLYIGRYAIGREWTRLQPGATSAKYLNLVRPDPDRPYPTVTQKGGDVTAASATHWAEARKLTLGELRRIGGFPDDFVLTGSYAQRWERIGRAVPPVMMSHIAAAVRDQILRPLREDEVI